MFRTTSPVLHRTAAGLGLAAALFVGGACSSGDDDRAAREGVTDAGAGDADPAAAVRVGDHPVASDPAPTDPSDPATPVVVPVQDGRGIVVDAPGIDLDPTAPDGPVVVEPTEGSITLPDDELGGASFVDLLTGLIGSAPGAELEHLGAHLRPEVSYLYVVLEDDSTLDLGPLAIDLPSTFELPGGGRSVLVVDPTDPYVYAGFPCDGGQGAPIELDLALSSYERDCGVGISFGGAIPTDLALSDIADADPAFRDLTPEVVLDGEIPLGKVTVAGTVFVDVDADLTTGSVTQALLAEGELSVGLPGKAAVLPLRLPVGRATAGRILHTEATTADRSTEWWLAGTLGDDIVAEGDLAFVADLASGEGDIDVEGRLGLRTVEGIPSVDADSFLDLRGAFALRPGPWSPAGTSEPVVAGDGHVRIDASALRATGRIATSPVPGIDLGGEAELTLDVPFDDPSASHLLIEGSFRIADVDLDAGGRLEVAADGITVDAHLTTPTARVALSGTVGADGIELTGEAGVSIRIGDLDQVADAVARDAGARETARQLEDLLDDQVDAIARTDAEAARKLRNQMDFFRERQAGIDELLAKIERNDAKIADHRAQIEAIEAAWDDMSLGDRFVAGGEKKWHQTAIAGLNTANWTHEEKLEIGSAALAQVREWVSGFTAREHPELVETLDLLVELRFRDFTADYAEAALRATDVLLDAFGIDGTITGTVTVTLGTAGLDGAVELSWCTDDGCTRVAAASITFPDFEVCATVVGIEACTPV